MYDLVFMTHLPSFYKISLYNELAKVQKILVIFVGENSLIRDKDFVQEKKKFEFVVLNSGEFESRDRLASITSLIKILLKCSYRRLVVGGWDLPEFWAAVLLSRKSKNALALESSEFESEHQGLKAMLKRIFLMRISLAFPSGLPHLRLLEKLGYKGECRLTKGVGLFTRTPKNQALKAQDGTQAKEDIKIHNASQTKRFLFVGRLSPEKNVDLLIEAFQEMPDIELAIVGKGPLEGALKAKVRSPRMLGAVDRESQNIHFLGTFSHAQMHQVYEAYDALILPSKYEPWGLVVEEALYHGLPVLVSDAVGCHLDLVVPGVNGFVFKKDSKTAIKEAVLDMVSLLNTPFQIPQNDFIERDAAQVNAYLFDKAALAGNE